MYTQVATTRDILSFNLARFTVGLQLPNVSKVFLYIIPMLFIFEYLLLVFREIAVRDLFQRETRGGKSFSIDELLSGQSLQVDSRLIRRRYSKMKSIGIT